MISITEIKEMKAKVTEALGLLADFDLMLEELLKTVPKVNGARQLRANNELVYTFGDAGDAQSVYDRLEHAQLEQHAKLKGKKLRVDASISQAIDRVIERGVKAGAIDAPLVHHSAYEEVGASMKESKKHNKLVEAYDLLAEGKARRGFTDKRKTLMAQLEKYYESGFVESKDRRESQLKKVLKMTTEDTVDHDVVSHLLGTK